jgi:hypothetical protein
MASCYDRVVRDLAVLFLHLLVTVARLAGPGGARSVVAESVLVNHQLLILNRSRRRSPNLRVSDRMVAGLCALLMRPRRLIRCAIVLKRHASNRGLWGASRRRGWRGAVPDVQSRNSVAHRADVSQLGPRSAVTVPPVAGESADSRRERSEDRAVRAALASVRGTADWHHPSRMSGPHAVLDGR